MVALVCYGIVCLDYVTIRRILQVFEMQHFFANFDISLSFVTDSRQTDRLSTERCYMSNIPMVALVCYGIVCLDYVTIRRILQVFEIVDFCKFWHFAIICDRQQTDRQAFHWAVLYVKHTYISSSLLRYSLFGLRNHTKNFTGVWKWTFFANFDILLSVVTDRQTDRQADTFADASDRCCGAYITGTVLVYDGIV